MPTQALINDNVVYIGRICWVWYESEEETAGRTSLDRSRLVTRFFRKE
jgi:hypothetical protein